ncbi:hypothetical protein HanRHA438_Chr09g0381391 [Helianthus annuus]|nr:hypothetical protein HanRHA438_Chr09g0381391 [Helianthus annuus]
MSKTDDKHTKLLISNETLIHVKNVITTINCESMIVKVTYQRKKLK